MRRVLLTISMIVMASGCHQVGSLFADAGPDADSDSDSDVDTDSDSDTDSDTDSDGDSDIDTDTDGLICDEFDFSIEASAVRLVFLLDKSGSMGSGVGSKMEETKDAINAILGIWAGGQIEFGFDYFATDSYCTVNSTIPISPTLGTETAITNMINGISSGGNTPTEESMLNYLSPGYTTGFPEAGVSSYLVLITDGSPDCASGDAASFATTTGLLLTSGIKTVAIGFDYTSQSLDNISANGGMASPYDAPMIVYDSSTLQNAFDGIADTITNCIYDITIINDVDYDSINFFLIDSFATETALPYDEDCSCGFGWHWVSATTHEQIEFCPDTCDLLQGGAVEEIKGEFGCPQIVVD